MAFVDHDTMSTQALQLQAVEKALCHRQRTVVPEKRLTREKSREVSLCYIWMIETESTLLLLKSMCFSKTLFAMPKLENRGVIESLKRATRRGAFVLVLIQKEEWLRAGEDASEEQKSLRGEYNTVGIFDYGTVNSVLHRFYCIGGEWKFGDTSNTLAIRCLGDEAKISTNLIQESFVVFGTQRHSYATVATGLSPYVATTVSIGSYNVSNCDQFESVVRIRDDAIAQRYGEHFAIMFLNSEPLDWESAIARPEFTRIKN